MAVVEESEPIVDHAVDAAALCVLVAIEHFHGVEIEGETRALGMVRIGTEPAQVEIADLRIETRMVDIDDGVGGPASHLPKKTLGIVAVEEDGAVARLLQIL